MNLVKRSLVRWCLAGSLATAFGAGSLAHAEDLRDAAPNDAFLVVYGMKNPERDYMKKHYAAVWKEVQNTRIVEQVLQLAQSKMAEGDAEQFIAVRDALTNALAPVEWAKLTDMSEMLYAQKIEGPTAVHLMMARIPDGGAESLKKGVNNLFDLAVGASGGELSVETETVAGVEMKHLKLPVQGPVQFQPAIGVKGDVFIFTTSIAYAQQGLELLANPSASSKFDDTRVVDALARLPKAEDSVAIFDGEMLSAQLAGIPEFINQVANGNPEAAHVSQIISEVLTQTEAFDYEVTVEYTEGYSNRTAAYGKFSENAGETVIGKMLVHQEDFDNWSQIVPQSATGFSVNSGLTLLPLYDWVVEKLPEMVPGSQEGLDQFEAIQNQFDVHVREDILEAFPGGSVSLAFAGAPGPMGAQGSKSVTMLRCSKPERVSELLHRAFNAISEIPEVQSQGLALKPAKGLEGFEAISANPLNMAGISPVIGFRDGWMVIGTHTDAVETALVTQGGEQPGWSETEKFKSFGLPVEGAVKSISYENTGESIRAIAMGLQQAGMFAPMMIQMAASQNPNGGNQEVMQTLQQAAALLPSIGRIVGKMDFMDSKLEVCQPGPEEGTWIKHSVTLVKPPVEEKPSEKSTGKASDTKAPRKK
ncbi:MAG: hypothetical protein JNM43_19640 [Planctomycetaceae bacterium]|nr:hypothetical protein [Planctomycetaceae bacterium]